MNSQASISYSSSKQMKQQRINITYNEAWDLTHTTQFRHPVQSIHLARHFATKQMNAKHTMIQSRIQLSSITSQLDAITSMVPPK
jgi:hypothetical protein